MKTNNAVLIVFATAILLTVGGCTMPVHVDDRLTYQTTSSLKAELGQKYNMQLSLDEESKKLVLAQAPAGFGGSANTYVVKIGQVLDAYLLQISDAISNGKEKVKVTVKLLNPEAKFTLSNYEAFRGRQGVFDYFMFSTGTLTTYHLGGQHVEKKRDYKSEIELGTIDIQTERGDAAIAYVLEDIGKKLIRDAVSDMDAGIKNLPQ